MAEEPRRSGRQNKGQKPLGREEVKIPVTQKAKDKQRKSGTQAGGEEPEPELAAETADEDVIRCVCGATSEDETEREFVQCESCNVWQHNQCVLGKASTPENYFCEQCRPDLHDELLRKMAEGKTMSAPVQETVMAADIGNATFDDEDEEEALKAPAGRSMRELLMAAKASHSAASNGGMDSRSRAKKRKSIQEDSDSEFEADDAPPVEHRQKSRRFSSTKPEHLVTATHERKPVFTPPLKSKTKKAQIVRQKPLAQLETSNTIAEILDSTRRSVAGVFQRALLPTIVTAASNGKLDLHDDSPEKRAEKLAIEIEHAMYMELTDRDGKDVGQKYRDRSRTLSFNLRDEKNPGLRARVVFGEITPQRISTMPSEELANQELRELTDAVRAESTKQSVLRAAEGPRIRRTHKGEELVEGEQEFSKSTSENTAPASFSTNHKEDPDNQSPTHISNPSPPQSSASPPPVEQASYSPESKSPVTVQAEVLRKSSGSNFDIKNVWNSVRSPSTASAVPMHSPSEAVAQAYSVQEKVTDADPEIERMFEDEDNAPASPPYSPSQFALSTTASPPSFIWEGKIGMNNVSTFTAYASFAGGLDMKARWDHVLEPVLSIEGRIAHDTATEYLCNQRFSQSKSLVAVMFTAKDREARGGFDKLFSHLQLRKRYGVLKHNLPNVRDSFLITLDVEEKLPEFFYLVDGHQIPEGSRRHKILLGVYVVAKVDPLSLSPLPGAQQSISIEAQPAAAPSGADIKATNPEPIAQAQQGVQDPLSAISGIQASEAQKSGISPQDLQLLQAIIAENPSVDSEMLSNPNIMARLIRDHQNRRG